jgi:riboflavin kinase/FMN adenylyltransferase
MQLVQGLPQAISDRPTVLTIGVFDGVHRGHQHLIGSAIQRAKELGYQSAVLTFDPHPDLVIRPERDRHYLSTLEQRAEYIEQLGADLLIVMPFSRAVMAQTALEFMTQICQALPLRELWVGHDFALGRGREGNIARLSEIGTELGYTVHPVDALSEQGEVISSSSIRRALIQGDIATANRLLARPFTLRGKVIEGDKRGRTIGFPTANLDISVQHLLPADGVYVGKAYIPTFDGIERRVEAYLLDFSGNIYGQSVDLEFLEFLRGDIRFESVEALIDQIAQDVQDTRDWLAKHPS